MITRGIVTYSDSNQLKVYVPILQGKVDENLLSSNDSEKAFQGLPVTSVLAIPGIKVTYKPGDVVLVGFEDNIMSNIIILGYLGSTVYNV